MPPTSCPDSPVDRVLLLQHDDPRPLSTATAVPSGPVAGGPDPLLPPTSSLLSPIGDPRSGKTGKTITFASCAAGAAAGCDSYHGSRAAVAAAAAALPPTDYEAFSGLG